MSVKNKTVVGATVESRCKQALMLFYPHADALILMKFYIPIYCISLPTML